MTEETCPTTHYSEAALERRQERFAALAAFPGRLVAWDAAVGRRVAAARETPAGELVVFDDGAWLLAGEAARDDLQAALLAARDLLEPSHAAAFADLDERIAAEKEAMRLARLEKILGAVETNLPEIPELKEALRRKLGL